MNGDKVVRAALLLAAGCTTPLSNRIAVGEEPYVIGVGEGNDQQTDLYAASANGGSFLRLTFTRLEERHPRISPEGTAVAFFRADPRAAASQWSVVVYDLRRNDERVAELPAGAAPEALGWSRDGSRLAVRAGGLYLLSLSGEMAPVPVAGSDAEAADSLTRELLGSPPTGMISPCEGAGLCVAASDGNASPLPGDAADAIRWGGDSLGYFTARGFEVRPLAGGRSRRPVWSSVPGRLRQLTYHGGTTATPPR